MVEETQVVLTPAQRYVGSPIKRSEDTRILTGQGCYVDDIALPGMLHAAFVRSPVAHGRIVEVITDAAREAPGVVAVVSGDDLEQSIVPGPTASRMMGGAGRASPCCVPTRFVWSATRS